MYNKISSTYLKQNLKSVLKKTTNTDAPTIVFTYNEPQVVIIPYSTWTQIEGKTSKKSAKKFVSLWDKVKNNTVSTGRKTDSVKFFRSMRDED